MAVEAFDYILHEYKWKGEQWKKSQITLTMSVFKYKYVATNDISWKTKVWKFCIDVVK